MPLTYFLIDVTVINSYKIPNTLLGNPSSMGVHAPTHKDFRKKLVDELSEHNEQMTRPPPCLVPATETNSAPIRIHQMINLKECKQCAFCKVEENKRTAFQRVKRKLSSELSTSPARSPSYISTDLLRLRSLRDAYM